jgi:hypothetical protein
MSFYLLSNVADSKRTSKGLFKDGESMEPLQRPIANYLLPLQRLNTLTWFNLTHKTA